MTPRTVLLVEDELSIHHVIQTYLQQEGFEVIWTDKGKKAIELARQHQPDLIILDLGLPDMDGMEVAARLRQESEVYILMLTARSEEVDRVAGLRIGADDYLTKPFSPRELVARVQAILRRQRGQVATANRVRQFEHIRLNPEQYEVWADDKLLNLTTTEFNLLLELARRPGRVLNREQLIERVWGADFYGTDRVVDVYVGQVRRKLEEATGELLIVTVRGVGYKFVDNLVGGG